MGLLEWSTIRSQEQAGANPDAARIRLAISEGPTPGVRPLFYRVLPFVSTDPAEEDILALIMLAGMSGDPAAVRAAGALRQWLDSTDLSLEQALGRANGWRKARRRQQRERRILELAQRYPDKSGRPLARAVHDALPREGRPSLDHVRTLLCGLKSDSK
jgi:hypothetical protein